MLDATWVKYPNSWNDFDNMWEKWPEIARTTGKINWELINPNDLVAIVAWLAQRAMENNPTTQSPENILVEHKIISEDERLRNLSIGFDTASI